MQSSTSGEFEMDDLEPKQYFESLDLFYHHMPDKSEHELIVLKGHLLIERTINKIITENVRSPAYIEELRLQFAQKAKIARALVSEDAEFNWIWNCILKLNSTRNEIAHELISAEQLEKSIGSLIAYTKQQYQIPFSSDEIQEYGELMVCLFHIYAHLNWGFGLNAH